MQVVHLGISGFPHNVTLAPIQKSYLIYKGLVEAGAEVLYINTIPQATSKNNHHDSTLDDSAEGVLDGINYVYTCGTPYRSESFLKRNWTKLRGILGEIALLQSLLRQKKVDIAVLYTAHFSTLLYYRIWSKLFGFPLVMNYVEYRSAFETNSAQKKISWLLTDRYAAYLVDAMLPISEFLIQRTKKLNPQLPYLKVPALCDFTRYTQIERDNDVPRYLLYCGSAAYYEVANFIIASFEQVKASNVHLYLIINGWPAQKQKVTDRITQSPKKELIKTFSQVSNEDYSRLLFEAEGLLIPLRPTVQDTARFPNKVGEYVASGNPMVATQVAEIAYYFMDNVSAFLATNYQVESFALKIQQLIDEPAHARAVGLEGKEVGHLRFDYRKNGEKMLDFFESIFETRRYRKPSAH